MSHKEFEELYGLYALGSLDTAEQSQLETHLQTGCTLCQGPIREMQETLAMFPYALSPVLPPRALKQNLLEALRRDTGILTEDQGSPGAERTTLEPPVPTADQRFPASNFYRILTLIAACLALVLGGYAFSLWQNVSSLKNQLVQQQQETGLLKDQLAKQQQEMGLLKDQLAKQQQEGGDLKEQLAKAQDRIRVLTAAAVRTIILAGVKNRDAKGKVFLDPTKRNALFYAYNLPPAPTGKTYQLWVIKDSKPISAGIFSVDPDGNGFLEVSGLPSDLEKINATAVTLEPAGGRPAPTGDKYLLGS
jgi:anti-sigma-K factor RskA